MEYKKNLIPGVILAVFSVVYYCSAMQVETFKQSGATPLTARFVPCLWAVCLFILSCMLIIRGIKQKKQIIAKEKEDITKHTWKELLFEHYEIIGTFILLFLYIALMESVGFLIMSILYLYFQILLLTPKAKRRYILTAVVAVIISFVIDYIFVMLLNVLLPLGIFGF